MSIPTYREYFTDYGRCTLVNSLQPGDIFKSVNYDSGHEECFMVLKRKLYFDERREWIDPYPEYTLLKLGDDTTLEGPIFKRDFVEYYLIG